MKKLIVDIGKYSVSYSVVHELDNSLEMFKFELITMPDYLFTERGTSFIGKVIDVVKMTLLNNSPIGKVIFTIPSRDVLLVSSKPLSPEDILKEMKKEYLVSQGDKLVQAVGEPYKSNKSFYTPVSVYDEALDVLLSELNKIDSIEPFIDKNKLRSDVYFQTTLGRMRESLKSTEGKVAIIDMGYTSTRVMLGEDGVPLTYKEFRVFSGERMLEYIYAHTEVSMTDILGKVTNYNNMSDKSDEVIMLADKFMTENIEPIIEYLKPFNLKEILMYGGLSNADPLKGTNLPYKQVLYDKSMYPEVPEHFLYKISYNDISTEEGTILDPRNLDIIVGKSKYPVMLTNEEKERQYRLKVEEQKRKRSQKDLSESTNLDSNQSILEEIEDLSNMTDMSENDYQDSGNSKDGKSIRKEIKPAPIIKIHELDDVAKSDVKVARKEIGSVHPEDEKIIDTSKKKHRRPSRREPLFPIIITITLISILAIGTLFLMNDFGWISVKQFEIFGITEPDTQFQVDIIKDSMLSAISNVNRRSGLPEGTIQTITDYNNKTRNLTILIGIPEDAKSAEDVAERLYKLLSNMDLNNRSEITEAELSDGYYKMDVVVKIK